MFDWFMRALMVEYHYLQTLPPIAYKPSHNSILSPRTTTMEVYDLTGTREMVSMEKANEIAKVIEENAATLRNVIFRTKTYSPEVAAVIAGTSLLSPLSLSALAKATHLESLDLSDTLSGLPSTTPSKHSKRSPTGSRTCTSSTWTSATTHWDPVASLRARV